MVFCSVWFILELLLAANAALLHVSFHCNEKAREKSIDLVDKNLIILLHACEQQRRRPACASAYSDQHLCYSLYKMYKS